jgi:UDP-N-acetylglucosamine 4,6-dehydratase
MKVADLAKAIDPAAYIRIVGIRPGEKLHETLISEDESRKTVDIGKYYVVLPQFIGSETLGKAYAGRQGCPEGFIYRSDLNKEWLDVNGLREMIATTEMEGA